MNAGRRRLVRHGAGIRSRRQRKGAVLISGLIFIVLFYSLYCFKQWQANRSGKQYAGRAAEAKQPADPQVRWRRPSLDRRYLFEAVAADGRAAHCQVSVTNLRTEAAVMEFQSAGRFHYGQWRSDSRAFLFEKRLPDGTPAMTLLVLDDDRVIRRAIEPSRLIPDQFGGRPHQWHDHVRWLGWGRERTFTVSWVGIAKLLDSPGEARFDYHCKIGFDNNGELSLSAASQVRSSRQLVW